MRFLQKSYRNWIYSCPWEQTYYLTQRTCLLYYLKCNSTIEIITVSFSFVNRFEQLREDKADVVAFLKRALQQRPDQISDLQGLAYCLNAFFTYCHLQCKICNVSR